MTAPAVTPKVEPLNIGDILKYEIPMGYCREKLTLKTSTSQTIKMGSMLRDNTGYILVANGQEANVTAIALEAVVATGDEEIVCLVRGPAIVDSDRIEEQAETSVTWSEVVTYLLALGILGRVEADEIEEGLPAS